MVSQTELFKIILDKDATEILFSLASYKKKGGM